MSKISTLIVGLAFLIVVVWVGSGLTRSETSLGSVSITDEYLATSTAASTIYGATITGDSIIKTGRGTLGSVVVLGANTGVLNFYDATTTDVDARTGNKATSTILVASLPASLAAGTYTFDVEFSDGLFMDLVSGNAPTTTITYRDN